MTAGHPQTSTGHPVDARSIRTHLGIPADGVTTSLTPYMRWICSHLTRGRSLRTYDADDYLIQGSLLDWVHQSGLFRPDEDRRLQAYGIPLLAGVWFDHEDVRAIAPMLKLMVWISSIDDKVNELGFPQERYLTACGEALRAGTLPSDPDMFHHSMIDIRNDYIAAGGERLLDELAASIDTWLAATHQEEHWRLSGQLPTISEFLANRQASIGCFPVFVGLRLKPGVLAPGELLSPTLAQLRWLVCRIIGIENDIYSCHKEERDDTHRTFLEVIGHTYGVDLPHALLCAMAMSAALRTQHDELVTSILHDPNEAAESIRYAELLATVVDGQIEWASSSARYGLRDFIPTEQDYIFPA